MKSRSSCPRGFTGDGSHVAELLAVLGAKKLRALQEAFGGRRIWVPKAGKQLRCDVCSHRDDCVRIWRSNGDPVSRIARRVSITPKSVYRILSGRRKRR